MLYLSGQPSKEVHYEDSIYREQRLSILLSVIVAFGHESYFHGPLFSTLMAMGPQWDRSRRWTLEHVIYVSLLMVLETEPTLTDQQIGQFYRMRWDQEVFHRSFKQTLAQHTMHSGSPGEARRESDWALMAYLMLGLWSVQAQVEAHRDPLAWSVAESLRVVRGAMRPAGGVRRGGDLVRRLQRAVKDTYVRNGSKSARDWPRKKNDHPPGLPKMREASPKEKHRAERTYERTKRT